MVGCSVIIKNMNGDSLGVMAIPIGEQMNHVAEASAALYGLSYAKSLIWTKFGSRGTPSILLIGLIKLTILLGQFILLFVRPFV